MINYPVRVGQFADAVFAFIKDSSDRMICGGLSREDAEEIVSVLNAQSDLRNQQWNAERIIQWMDDPDRKPAIHAFTAGNERQIAYRYERAIEEHTLPVRS